MGCFASKEATPEEVQEICKQMSKEMMNICLEPALANADKIVVKLPTDFNRMKEAAEKLRKLAADSVAGAPSQDKPAAAEGPAAGGGGMMGMLNKGLAMAEKAMETVGDAVGQGFAVGFNSAADVLDNAVQGVEKPMSTIGADLITAKRAELIKVLSNHIVSAKVDTAFDLCQGPNTAISEYIIGQASGNLSRQLMTVVGVFIADHDTIKMWDAAIGKYNKAIEAVNAAGMADKLQLKGIQLDIKEYICEQAVLGLCEQMAAEETKVRAAPQGKATRSPAVFFKVFNKDKLMQSDYKTVTST